MFRDIDCVGVCSAFPRAEEIVLAHPGISNAFSFAGAGGLNTDTSGGSTPKDLIGQIQFETIPWEDRAGRLDLDGNIVIAYKYEYDTAILMGDWGYHYTSEIQGYKDDEKRVVVGMYCGEISDRNAKMYAHLYDGEDPAPFLGQFEPPYELHWSKGNPEEHRLSRFAK